MNIAIISDTYFPSINGISSSIYTLATSLRARGHKVYIFTVSEPRSGVDKTKSDPDVYRFPSVPLVFIRPHRAAIPFSAKLMHMMHKLDIDIIHTQTEFFMGFVGINVATTMRIPLIHTYHTMLEDYTHYVVKGPFAPREFARKYSRVFCNMAQSVIVPTKKVEKVLKSYRVKRPIYVIPSGIDLEPFNPSNHPTEEIAQLKTKIGISPEHKVLLCLGRVAREKSMDQIVSKMPDIIKLIPNARLLIVGDGPALCELKKQATRLGLKDYIYFAGSVPFAEVSKYYQLGDIFMSCSVTETQGLTYYEAMASGLPVVARNDDSISHLLIDYHNCRLFDQSDDIPEAVHTILSNDNMTQYYSKKAREAVESYSASIFSQRVEDAYKNTIDRARLHSGIRRNSLARLSFSGLRKRVKLVSPALKKSTIESNDDNE